ncbi:unnamed protein product (macronuclear) [Paramecium tetraurelia]|uniref:Protein kinase domain-containing protein n=1 Tax=Paramecium tetraurelia TaxID=5888 RepID=A0EFH0_PARTE|nr:uncharacterized protein GSPATT00026384001 [Paramecium tetraurelia]CAK94061.1 unnamed protein product [Paramecium tetraurelia]|eukprot:XP_001461434.1 hypothetical protein (macronuclear) [Paramecium tetraurelia strain d4-2]
MQSLVSSARFPSASILHKKKSSDFHSLNSNLTRVQSPSGNKMNQAFGRCQTMKTLNSERDPVEITISLILNGQKFIVPISIYQNTTDLYKKLIAKVLQVNPSIVNKIKHFQTHSSVKNYNIDYYLSLELKPLEVFEEQRHLKLEPYYSNPVGNQMSIEDYDILKCIGVGGFSRVYLVRKRDNGLFYAMKLIDKNFILKSNKEIIICNEKYVMEHLNSQYLAKLFYSFETKFYLVFVMEYCAGGELFFHLRKWKRLTEPLAKQYFVQVCLAINELHKFGIVYRDIKPENILLDLDGYIRLSDFGLSKPNMNRDETAYSFCGSPEYMSPEMLKREGHNFMVDIYCLGALLYEFIFGSPPFYCRNIDQIYNSILNDKVQFPPFKDINPDLKDLISSLLIKDPSKRLGAQDGIRAILQHRWFQGCDIEALVKRRCEISYKPMPLKYNFDEMEFSKGDNEFLKRLYDNLRLEKQGKFTRSFPHFEYTNKRMIDYRQVILDQLTKSSQIQGQQGLPKKQQKTQICVSPVSQVKEHSNILKLISGSFKQSSQGKRFNTDTDLIQLMKQV